MKFSPLSSTVFFLLPGSFGTGINANNTSPIRAAVEIMCFECQLFEFYFLNGEVISYYRATRNISSGREFPLLIN
jgi:hypothetical protein